jgi:hypothetical protein
MDARPNVVYGFSNFDQVRVAISLIRLFFQLSALQTGNGGQNDGILMIRDPVNATAPPGTLGQIECKYAVVTGTGDSRQLKIVTLGGYTWDQQCALATYRAIPNVASQPFCTTNGASSDR